MIFLAFIGLFVFLIAIHFGVGMFYSYISDEEISGFVVTTILDCLVLTAIILKFVMKVM